MIKPDSCIFIDSGSTYLLMVNFIPHEMELTIVTNIPPNCRRAEQPQKRRTDYAGRESEPAGGERIGFRDGESTAQYAV